uniref:Uncharacterized protein n=1 Tax=Saimiri boliviensis boliviensis TaxID=39432 RepID=A0A2K6ST63_SAIBB
TLKRKNESHRSNSCSRARIGMEVACKAPLPTCCVMPPIDTFLCLPFGFALVSDKLFQGKEPVISSVHNKVKKIAEVKEEIVENGVKKLVHSVFNTADYTFPLLAST